MSSSSERRRPDHPLAWALLAVAGTVAATEPSATIGTAAAPGAASAAAEAGTGFTIEPWTIDGGSEVAAGGGFELSGTVGQPDADTRQPATGGDFALTGGFWPAAEPPPPRPDPLFANGFE